MARMAATMLPVVFGAMMLIASHLTPVLAADPDSVFDYNINATKGSDFAFTGFRNPPTPAAGALGAQFASFVQFPGLTGLGLTSVLFEFGPGAQVNPHSHPRGSEVFYVLTGIIDVAFVDTANTLFETTLYAGDLFVFPKGLVHYQRNNEATTASGYSVLNSENPGLQFVVPALFTASGTGFPDDVLASALATTVTEVKSLKKGLTPV